MYRSKDGAAPGVHPGVAFQIPTLTWPDAIARHDNWLAAADHSPGTRRLRAYYLGRFARSCANPWTASLDDMAAFLAHPTWSAETRKSARSSLRSLYGWAAAAGYVDRDPTPALPRVRVPSREPRPASEQRLNAALATSSDRDRLMLMLGAYAGLRAAEIAGIRLEDLRDNTVWVRGKGDKVRRVPLHPRLALAMNHELAQRQRGQLGSGHRYGDASSPYLFPGQQPGSPITPGAVGRILKRRLGERGHSLRTRFVTNLSENGVPVFVIQRLVGHSSPNSLQAYVAVSEQALRNGVGAA